VATIRRARSTLQFAFAPFFFYFVQSVIYTLYGYTTSNLVVGGTSFLGVVLGGFYVASYYRFAGDKRQARRLLSSAAVFLLLLASQVATKPLEDTQLLTGVPANVLSFLTASSPLLQLPAILRTKDASGLPFGMSVMNVVAGSVWTTYGLMLDDPLVILPNLFALVMGVIQVSLVFMYPGGKVSNASATGNAASADKTKTAKAAKEAKVDDEEAELSPTTRRKGKRVD
jgi:solute carrier family 50 protein (sugar transporter)